MKGALSLEFIGATTWDRIGQFEKLEALATGARDGRHPFDRPGPCVLRLYRIGDRITHERIWGKRDYSRANSKGTRGVFIHYVLEQNKLYWVKAPQSWRSVAIYHCAVMESGDIYHLSKNEVEEWLSVL